jgi:hypothetical protein
MCVTAHIFLIFDQIKNHMDYEILTKNWKMINITYTNTDYSGVMKPN